MVPITKKINNDKVKLTIVKKTYSSEEIFNFKGIDNVKNYKNIHTITELENISLVINAEKSSPEGKKRKFFGRFCSSESRSIEMT